MARIGIYGGTFNPIHNTHLNIAKAAFKQFELDELYFLVAGDPPHKKLSDNVTAFNRIDMVGLAISDINGFSIDDREIFRSGKSYSYITLTEYKHEHPDDEIYFIMGSDSLINFENWVKPEIISSCATILSAPRLGDDEALIKTIISKYNDVFEGDFYSIEYEPNSISSTEIRDILVHDGDASEFINADVLSYIKNHRLYKETYDYDKITFLAKEMEKELKPGRYIHTLGVASTAYSLALKWNYPAYNAMVAGMLHDCAKCLSDEKRISICEKHDIPITDIEYKFPHLLHGKVGAYLANTKYDIDDYDILHSIEIHTIGMPNMSLLDKIIYVADYIEPGRVKQPRLDLLRKVAYEDLDLCVYMILEDTVNYLSENPETTDPATIETFNYYKKLRGIENEF